MHWDGTLFDPPPPQKRKPKKTESRPNHWDSVSEGLLRDRSRERGAGQGERAADRQAFRIGRPLTTPRR
jgi:hypothetical protein